MNTDTLLFFFVNWNCYRKQTKIKFIFKLLETFQANTNLAFIFLKLQCTTVFYMTFLLINVMQKLQFPAESELLTF